MVTVPSLHQAEAEWGLEGQRRSTRAHVGSVLRGRGRKQAIYFLRPASPLGSWEWGKEVPRGVEAPGPVYSPP